MADKAKINIMEDVKKENRGGARPGAGRKSREDVGLEPLVTTSLKVEQYVLDACKAIHGSYAEALRYASKSKKKPLK